MTNRLVVISGCCLAVLAASCNREGRKPGTTSSIRGSAARFVAPRETLSVRGIYRRDGAVSDFRLCEAARNFRVTGEDSVMSLLDANVDWHAARPTTVIFAEVRGDTTDGPAPESPGNLAVVAVDSMRGLGSGECAQHRPFKPQTPTPEVVAATLRIALGADSALAVPTQFRSVAVWIDSDTRPDLLILAEAPKLCSNAGCTLFVFRGTVDGYQQLGRTVDVALPIQVRQWPNDEPSNTIGMTFEATEGKTDLQVKVKRGAFGVRDAILRYRDGHYPRSASFEPPPGGRRGYAIPNGTTVLR